MSAEAAVPWPCCQLKNCSASSLQKQALGAPNRLICLVSAAPFPVPSSAAPALFAAGGAAEVACAAAGDSSSLRSIVSCCYPG